MKKTLIISAALLVIVGVCAAVYYSRDSKPAPINMPAYHVIKSELSAAIRDYKAKAAVGIVMNAKTGNIVASVALPTDDVLNQNYEMGSIFTMFNTALAFENGINREYNVSEPFKIQDKDGNVLATIRDNFKPSKSNMTVADILLHSSNIGSAQIALDLPDDAQRDLFKRLYLDRGLLPKNWGLAERATVLFGHDIAVSPTNLLFGANAIINDGVYVSPKTKGNRIISSDNSGKVRQILGQIAKETNAKIPGINIGIKTSTAEKRSGGVITATFATFPIESPDFSMLILLDEPQTKPSSAAYNAVPITGKIIDSIVPLLYNATSNQ
jgi:cell division protein FtsI (penicillin-binding protein 3)